MHIQLIPLKNLAANRLRTAILFLIVFAEAVSAMTGFLFVSHMQEAISLADARLGADIIVYPSAAMSRISADSILMQGTPVLISKSRSGLTKLEEYEGIQRISYQLYLTDTWKDGTSFWIVGYEPESDFVLAPWSETGSSALPEGTVLLGADFPADEDGTISLFGQPHAVYCRLTQTDSPLDNAVFVSMDTLAHLISLASQQGNSAIASVDPTRDYSAALIQLQDHGDAEAAAGWINIYIRKVKAIRSRETLSDVGFSLSRQQALISWLFSALFLLMLLSLFLSASMLTGERINEVYTWFVIGASRQSIRHVFLAETTWITLAALLLAIPVSTILLMQISAHTAHLSSFMLIGAFVRSALLCVPAGFLSTLVALHRLFRKMQGQRLLIS